MAAKRPTIYDVAREAGVSKSLVSLVLQGSDKVSAAKRDAVRRAIATLGYRPSRAATTLAANRSRTIGVLVDDYTNLWFVELLKGLRAAVEPRGYKVLLGDIASGGPDVRASLEGFLSLDVDGLVIAAEALPDSSRDLGIPVVVAGNRAVRHPGAVVVAGDDALGAEMAARHLLGLGHLRLGHLTGPGEAARVRAEAFRAAVEAHPGASLTVRAAEGTLEPDGYASAVELLGDAPEVTAVLAANDTMALGAAAALRGAGRRIPEDVSLMGYDDSPLAGSHLLDLSSVDYRGVVVGSDVGAVLLEWLDGGSPSAPPQAAPRIVPRGSTGPAPTGR
ncbi:LacI family DNA-binding transcriptional regulator [Zafaria sp. J156]|uniref:LacI family DNA-binding transcriptional regulator n=1 Tax=Zafaria sp. J156 TaxID=3116490 RepID=UPI002E78BD82|nr:LacI family DNA-binding transcriptional regulator [Zafaria sp. J156]MEE1622226.1 LacI family DNA-binding transcriptional regulator [Zafaria sp. J156]